MDFYKILTSIITIIYVCYIFTYPSSFYNDDSLFLAKGIDNFSIIDFSPHFPGYVSIVLLGKFLNIFLNDSKESLFILTALYGAFTPLVVFAYVKKLKDDKTAFVAFLLTISSVYILNISLSMLSESVGLFFFFLGLYFFEINKYKSSGVIFSIAFFSRPSYLIFYIVGLVYVYFFKKDALKDILIAFFFMAFIFLIYIFLSNGMLFIYEAKRFIFGHFTLWGTGQNSDISWVSNIFRYENIVYILLPLVFIKFDKKFLLILVLFISYFLWLIFAQNPENMRHLVPLSIFASILLSSVLVNYHKIIITIFVFNIYILFTYTNKHSPIDQIITEIKDEKKIVISNRSIEILRASIKNRVFDKYYINSSKYYFQNKKVYMITTIRPKEKKYKVFKGRFLGERDYYLIEN